MPVTDTIELYNSTLTGLAWNFQVNPLSCGNHEHYEQYIRFIAVSDQASGKGTTHAFIRRTETSAQMLGYITLRATSYTQVIGDTLYGNPAMEIFELSVCQGAEGRHIGSTLVKFALAKALELNSSSLGVQYVTLCADPKSVPFYEKLGFGRIDEQGDIPREQWNASCVPMVLKLLV